MQQTGDADRRIARELTVLTGRILLTGTLVAGAAVCLTLLAVR